MTMSPIKTIYTVTLIQKIDLEQISEDNFLPVFGDRRCVGYFYQLDDAILAVSNNAKNMHDNTYVYKYAVIEESVEGIFNYSKRRLVFEWKNNKYIQIDEPTELYQTCGFGIG